MCRLQDPSKRIMDYWGPSQKMLADANFINSLKQYDKDNINPKFVKEIVTRFLPDERFQPKNAEKASKAAAGLCKWVHAMITYDKVAKVRKGTQPTLSWP